MSDKSLPQTYKNLMMVWSMAAQQAGVTPEQIVVLSAQFSGLAVAMLPGSIEKQTEMLDLAARALRTSYAQKIAVNGGVGRAVVNEDLK